MNPHAETLNRFAEGECICTCMIYRNLKDAAAEIERMEKRLLKCEAALVDLIAGVERHTGCCNTEQLSECDLCRTLINAKKALKI
jgi:hypothetical protein